MAESVIKVEKISKSFGPVRAVQELSFSVLPAACFGFLGPNGAGKTTMMKMIYGKNTCDRGCRGVMDIFGFDPRSDELAIKNLSGVVPQEDNLDEELNVIQNLMIFARFYNLPGPVARRRITELLEFLELSEKTRSKIRELSGGMKRRLVIARALLNEPRLLILDEPTTGLDPQVRHLIWDKLRHLKRQGTTILLTTHYMEEAFQICDELIIMDKGQAILQGNPRQLLRDNIEPYVLEIMDGQSIDGLVSGDLLDSVRADISHEVSRLYSSQIDDLRRVAAALHSDNYVIRQSNLEDVFLKATGRSLNAAQ
ncbi:MAG: ATP-binding cassette domain-containing protein [Sedimentisphaerales bacterium]|nr:ATP-binding cassette domain-containing protein [Sedimentisphaerales bacterium]